MIHNHGDTDEHGTAAIGTPLIFAGGHLAPDRGGDAGASGHRLPSSGQCMPMPFEQRERV
jgi:hypothetical protein